MNNVVELDSAQTLETLFKRDYGSTKFAIAVYLDGKDQELATYISDDLDDMELCYLIDSLQERRRMRNEVVYGD